MSLDLGRTVRDAAGANLLLPTPALDLGTAPGTEFTKKYSTQAILKCTWMLHVH